MSDFGPHNAIWDDGEWVSWTEITSHLERLELEAQYPNANIDLIPLFNDMLELAQCYHLQTGKHLSIYGDIGELFGAIHFGIKLHKDRAKGSDGRIGDDFIEIKTITPFSKSQTKTLRMDRHFSKVLLVLIDEDFEVFGRLMDRKQIAKKGQTRVYLEWSSVKDIPGTTIRV